MGSLSWHLQRAMVLGATLFGFLALLYFVAPPFEPGRPVALLSVGIAIGCALVGWLDRWLDGRRAHALTFVAATGVALGPLGILVLSGDPAQTVVVVVCMMAGAGAIPSSAASSYFTCVLLVGWAALRPPMTSAESAHWVINVVAAAAASIGIAVTRERFVRTIVALARAGEEARHVREAQTRDIAEARDAALQSARAKGRFLANMSHEIRTPLNGIIGMLSLLRRTPLDATQSEYLDDVVRSSELLMAIVNDILDVSKIEAGAVELELVAFDIAELVEEVASAHAGSAHHRGVELIADIDANLPKQVVGDPLRVRQILTNLLSNAIKFTSEGEVVLAVRQLEPSSSGRVRLRLVVSDTGVGIDADKLSSIFNPFSQADSSTTRRFGGTGLGLSICRQLVELMGSELEVESTPGRGSTFSFELVLDEEDLLTTRGPKVHARLWDARVLVMDSSERMRLTLRSQLAAWGVEAHLASSAEEAARVAQSCVERGRPLDVAIVDVSSLGRPPMRAAQALGAIVAPLGCVMIAMGSSLGELREQLDVCGFATVLPKPIHRNRLLDALNVALGAHPIVPALRDSSRPSSRPASGPPLLVTQEGDSLLGRQTVLVVEDNETNQRVAVAQLRALGYEAEVAVDGADAVAKLDSPDHGYACVLMDGQMPVMDGYDATREVRRREARDGRPRVPILALTANAMQGERERATAAGMDGYLAKPFTLSQLNTALQDCCAAALAEVPSPPMDGNDPGANKGRSGGWRTVLDAAIVDQLKMLEGVSPGFFAQVVETYLSTSREHLSDLKAAIEAGDLPAAQRRAHALVGSSRQVGAMEVGALCASIERAASLSAVAPALAALPGAVDTVHQALSEAVAEG